jgi:hypothetical protein
MIYLTKIEMISTTGENTFFSRNILVFGRHAAQISVGRLANLGKFF